MRTNKWLYVTAAALIMTAGCSKDEGSSAESSKDLEVPKTFTEARAKGMVDVKYNAELQRLRKIHASPAIKINNELEAKKAELASAKSANAPKHKIDALEKECETLKEKAAKAEKKYTRKMMRVVQMQMIKERESLERKLDK